VFGIPFLSGAEQGKDDAEHASSDGDDGRLWGFAVGDEAIAVGLEDGL
jgi:hypothetical protein